MSSHKTIRLQNKTGNNLSLHLHQMQPRAAGSMRRGPMLTSILIGQGQYYDVCAQLGVDYDEAHRICQRSPEVQAFKHSNYLAEIHWPPHPGAPPVEQLTPVVEAVAPPVEEETPAPLVELTEVLDPDPTPAVGMPEPEMRQVQDTEVEAEAPAEAPAPRMVREPSMDWSEEELRDYAAKRGIDLSKAKSKTAVIRAIREKKG